MRPADSATSGLVPVQHRPAGPDPVEAQLERLAARLVDEAADDPTAMLAVRACIEAARGRFADARVRQYLPILVERAVRRSLRDGPGVAADTECPSAGEGEATGHLTSRARPSATPEPGTAPSSQPTASSLVGRRARLGCTRIGSPGIFG